MQFSSATASLHSRTDRWARMNAYLRIRISIERTVVSEALRCGLNFLRLRKIGTGRACCAVTTIMSGLPQELIDRIIDHVDDRNSLGACYLVSSRWPPRSSSIRPYRRTISHIRYPRHPGLTHQPSPMLLPISSPCPRSGPWRLGDGTCVPPPWFRCFIPLALPSKM